MLNDNSFVKYHILLSFLIISFTVLVGYVCFLLVSFLLVLQNFQNVWKCVVDFSIKYGALQNYSISSQSMQHYHVIKLACNVRKSNLGCIHFNLKNQQQHLNVCECVASMLERPWSNKNALSICRRKKNPFIEEKSTNSKLQRKNRTRMNKFDNWFEKEKEISEGKEENELRNW